MPNALQLLGSSHRVAPLEERERLSIPEAGAAAAISDLLASRGVDEAAVLSTCNRVEIVAVGDDAEVLRSSLRSFVVARVGSGEDWLSRHAYHHDGDDATRHLFRVTSSLDSLIVGEPQILGQVKQCFRTSRAAGGAGPVLSRLFSHAFHTAKRVRTETRLAENAVSVSFAAVELAKKVFGRLDGKRVLVVGAGKMGGLSVQHLIDAGANRIDIINRSVERAAEMAGRLGGQAHSLDALPRLLDEADIVISSTGSQDFVIRFEMVSEALLRRRYRPLFLVDIAVPRDVDPRCADLQNVYLFDVDDLGRVVEENLRAREREVAHADEIVRQEVVAFARRMQEYRVVPTIVQLREKLSALKQAELEKLNRACPGLDAAARESVERMAEALINKVLHQPTASLREASASGSNVGQLVAATRCLFGLADAPDGAEIGEGDGD